MILAVDLVGQTAAIVAGLGAIAKIVQVYMRGRVTGQEADALRTDSQWKRLEALNDDLRADNDRYRNLLLERDEECTALRKQRDECWAARYKTP